MFLANFKLKRTAAASRGFLATARISCLYLDLDSNCQSPVDIAATDIALHIYFNKTAICFCLLEFTPVM